MMGTLWLRLQMLWQKGFIRKSIYAFVGLIFFSIFMDIVVMPLYTRHGQAIPLPDVTKMLYEDARARL
ncbi:MAG: hypothetical protein ACE5I1_08870, partial [bacterium]